VVKTRTEASAGGVVYRPGPQGPEVVLASRRTKRGELAWGLPKGLIEPDEAPEETAVREVQEETGILAEIEEDLGQVSYFYYWEGVRVRKSVRFYLMRATGGDTSLHDHEMEEVKWFPLREGPRRATYRSEKDLLTKAVVRVEATGATEGHTGT
jgi:8-oxo-dGTP pyrophosphatase MutT (NUDIX family)